MFFAFILSLIVFFIVTAISGFWILGAIFAVAGFLGALPFVIIGDFVIGAIEYHEASEDCRRYRDAMDADLRSDRLVEAIGKRRKRITKYDNRQLHLHQHVHKIERSYE